MRLPILVICASLAGCAARTDQPGQIDVSASYEMRRTARPTMPRGFCNGIAMGGHYSAADATAVKLLGIKLVEDSDIITEYRSETRTIAIEPWMPRAVLLHEVAHAGQAAGGHSSGWQGEAGAMIVEVAALAAEGWSDARIRDLSRNNARSPEWCFTWIHQMGPQFTGTAADVPIAYEWGKSDAVWASVGSLMGPSISGACPADWATTGHQWDSQLNTLGLMP